MADQEFYEVERLLKKKVEGKKVFYLVRWKNYGAEHDSWEPASNLRSCSSMFKDFEKRQKAMKSSSVAAKLLKKSRELSKQSVKMNDKTGVGKKINKIHAKKKLVADLKSKSKISKGSVSTGKKQPTKKTTASSSSSTKGSSKGDKAKTPSHGRKTEQGSSSKKVSSSVTKRLSETGDAAIRDSAKKKKSSSNVKSILMKQKGSKTTGGSDAESSDSEVEVILNKTKMDKNVSKNSSGKDSKAKTPRGTQNVKSRVSQRQENGAQSSTGSDLSDSESDEDILYSLSETNPVGSEEANGSRNHGKSKKPETVNGSKQSAGKNSFKRNSESSGSSSSRRMSLLDFKKPKSSKQKTSSFEQLLRPSSPVPFFTPLKTTVQSPLRGTSVPSNTALSMDSLVGDVPTYHATPAGPLSPSSISYKTLLDNLPSQLHPRPKGKKKDNGNGSVASGNSSGDAGDSSRFDVPEPIERRISVRATECVFRYKQIVVKKCHRYTQIWLNTQTTLKNAFNPQVVQEVVAALNTAKYDDSSLVLFSSIGNFFCSGTDLHFLVTGDRRVAARQMADALRELTKAFITFPKPVVAAVGGAAVGLGVALLCLCDVVYTSDKASFHLPYAQLSQTPECCSSFTLPLALGLASANELLFGGRRITALEAYQLGLVSHVFWPTALMQEVIPRTQNMANCSAKVLEGTKLLIRSHHRTKLELTNETECNLLLERWASNECQRAIEAYLANERNFSH